MRKKLEKLFIYLLKKINYNSIICPFCYNIPYYKENVYFTDTEWEKGESQGGYYSKPSKSIEVKFMLHFCKCGHQFHSNYEITGKTSNKIIKY
jgi:hypothetical protein